MMTEKVKSMLEQENPPEEITSLLSDINSMLKHSRGKMNNRFSDWDNSLDVFNQKRCKDKGDQRARAKDEPQKMIVPMSYTQVMTFVTYAFMLLKQNQTFFSLNPTGNEDFQLDEVANKILERDLRKTDFGPKLLQQLLDFSRLGITASKVTWKTETTFVNITSPGEVSTPGPFGVLSPPTSTRQEVIKFEGNDIIIISPYRLLPDLRMPLTRWKEGRFVADEQEYNISYLKELAAKGVLVGVEYVQPLNKSSYRDSGRMETRYPLVESAWNSTSKTNDSDFMCISTEGHFKLEGKRYNLTDEEGFQDYIITIANDNRILRIEPAGYLHEESIYCIGQFLPDEHYQLNLALSDTISALQDLVTWLYNSRVISLRQGLNRHLVVNPQFIDTTALTQNTPIILTRKGAPAGAVNNFVQQIQYTDNTGQNIAEADILMRIMQTVTGVNENAMGQYAPGRRSATENRAANTGAASRMNLHVQLFWEQCCAPLGIKMLSNSRQGLSFDSFRKIIGQTSPNTSLPIEELYSLYSPAESELVGNEDFFVFDSSSKTEKQYIAAQLQELILGLASNPQLLALTNYDLTKLIDESNYLRGITNVNRLKRDVTPVDPSALLAPPNGSGGAAEIPPGADQLPLV